MRPIGSFELRDGDSTAALASVALTIGLFAGIVFVALFGAIEREHQARTQFVEGGLR